MKIIKIASVVIIGILILIAVFLYNISKTPFVPDNYTETVTTGGELEAKYMKMGPYDVSYMEYAALMSFGKYEIYYPSDIEEMNETLPVVIFVNGTGCKGSKYQALQKHMASWGIITVATEEEHAWNGFSAEMSVRMIEKLNNLEGEYYGKNNMFYQKIDTDNIGIVGHSQGGFGVVNAITDQKHKENYKSAVILSSAPSKVENDFQWEANPSLINIPSLIIGSTGQVDSAIASLEGLQSVYDEIPKETTKILARRNDADHGEMLYFADGYVTAWFMYWLKEDLQAGDVFFGTDPEILTNSNWQDVRINE